MLRKIPRQYPGNRVESELSQSSEQDILVLRHGEQYQDYVRILWLLRSKLTKPLGMIYKERMNFKEEK